MAIDFPASPTVGQTVTVGGVTWTWDGVKWVAQGTGVGVYLPLTGGTMTGDLVLNRDAQVALGAATKQYVDARGAGDNRLINGDMRIDQRGVASGAGGTAVGYTVDRWAYASNQASKGTWQRGGPFANTGAFGFPYIWQFTSSSAYASLTGDSFRLYQLIEGDMIGDLAWGAAGAQSVTLSFWAWSTLTGTFSGAFSNTASNRSYPFTYSIPAANTWTRIVVTVPGDTAGTWVMSGNGIGLYLGFDLGCGATLRGPANAWAAAQYLGATGSVSLVATNGASFAITGVKLEVGSIATPFNRQSLTKSLADCQRYYQSTGGTYGTFFCGNVTTSVAYIYVARYPVAMRANPTVVLTHLAAASFPAAAGGVSSATTQSFAESRTANATVNAGYFGSSYTADAEL
jgi:hypothetical protein